MTTKIQAMPVLTRNEIAVEVIRILSRVLIVDRKNILPYTELSSILVDSLDSVELVMALEDTFTLVIGDEEFDSVITVRDLQHCIYNKLYPHITDTEYAEFNEQTGELSDEELAKDVTRKIKQFILKMDDVSVINRENVESELTASILKLIKRGKHDEA